MANIKVVVIGYGYWGPNIVRNFFATPDCTVRMVADGRPERLNLLAKTFPSIQGVKDAEDIIGSKEVIEKPMTSSVREADELIELATKKGLTLMADHTFLYTGAVQKMKEIIQTEVIGTPLYFDSSRINLGLFQPDINVLWDLAPHDISILTYMITEIPESINATGISHTGNKIENIAYLTVNYNSNFIAHFVCSWSSPVKVRQTLIGGDKKMILYNDLEPSEKVRVYDTGYNHKTEEDRTRIMVDYRTGDVYIPKLSSREALAGVADDFIQSVIHKRDPMSNATLGKSVVRILEASQESIKNNGKEIRIK